ncbi:MAG TPA: hypothetical protein VNG93_13040 [Candidatus Dormibacteraeota bacterium]|nr:hypothetical protein [Candidatus Dormibacteraeota bacterium]
MTKGMRWRIVTLQAILVLVLGGASLFLISEGNFVNQTIHDQLAAQQISFPPASAITAGGALDPAKFSPEIRAQAGNEVLTGDQARIYANDFIAVHLKNVAGGKTYSQIDTSSGTAAQIATAQAQKSSLFQGETLRNMLLNAWGWSMLATYTIWGGFGLMLAALVALGALVYELFFSKQEDTVTVPQAKSTRVVPA